MEPEPEPRLAELELEPELEPEPEPQQQPGSACVLGAQRLDPAPAEFSPEAW